MKSAFTSRYNAGVTYADGRANTNSTNYKTGYNKGVTDADNRANTNSTNYKTGYNAGYSAGKSSSGGIRLTTYNKTCIQIQLDDIRSFVYSGSDGYFINGSYKGILGNGTHYPSEYGGTGTIAIGGGNITVYAK